MSLQIKWKLLQAVAAFAVLWILFSGLQRVLPKTLWVLLFFATLTFGISLFFGEKISPVRRGASAYLVLVGATYFLAGLITLLPHRGPISSDLWDELISPFPLLALIDQCVLYTRANSPKHPSRPCPSPTTRNSSSRFRRWS
jgi:hypothetical protein